ncbi:MAG: rhodanese-like domain-containing protein [Geothrix sp.]|nr:rhodanese-like domain-containing protein [Geothrix sp.]
MAEHWIYLIPLAAVAYFFWSRRSASSSDIKALLAKGAQIVDVRTKAEFKAAAHPKSINIPLNDLEKGSQKLDSSRPVLICCASGSRSGLAVSILKRKGFKEVHNLGSWHRIQSFLS